MRRALFIAGALAAMVAAPVAAQDRRATVSPYIEATQVLAADLDNGDDVVTYTGVAAGVDAAISGRRAEGQISYRYEHRFSWDNRIGDDDLHTGLARGSFQLTPALSVEGGALATRARSDIRGAAPGTFGVDPDNITQVYSLYAGPTLATNAGPVQFNALYRIGYTKADAPDATGIAPGLPRLDYFDDSTAHLALASAGVAAGAVLPVGVTVSGAYEREDAGQLKARYEGYYARGDVTAPVSRTVAVRAGAGYEKIETSQRDPLIDGTGQPVLDRNGRFVTDESSPRRIAYRTDGLIYDVGVVWRPNRRLELTANAGYRYGGETYFGTLTWRMRRNMGLQVVVYDGIETFGRQLRRGLENMPTAFDTSRDPFGQQFNGCVFGSQPGEGGQGAGGCLNDVFQSIATASYRARGVDAVFSVTRGLSSYGVGAGYANRRFYAPRNVPGIIVYGVEDDGYYGQIFYSRILSPNSGFDANAYVSYYDSGLAGFGANGVLGAGATASYYHNFGRLGTVASLGLYSFDQEGFDSDLSLQALLGARYQF